MIQSVVWSVSIILMAALAAVFAGVAAAGEVAAPGHDIAGHPAPSAAAYRARPWLLVIAVWVVVAVNYRTLGELPYAAYAGVSSVGPVQRVEAVGEQWSWSITPNQVTAGQPTEFHVTSHDVNHDFAVYDPFLRLVAQTQAMPGYDNVLRYTFTTPGTYHVLCLEYCGIAHHEMTTDFTVVQH